MKIILATLVALTMLTAVVGPSYGATEGVCITKEDAVGIIATMKPDAKVIRDEDKLLVFSSPTMPTDLSLIFNDEGCVVEQVETIKINA